MKQVLLLGGLYLSYASENWFGGDDHDLVDHGQAAEEEDSTLVETEETIFGNVMDEFGCLTDAGETWCAKLMKCLELFEVGCEEETTVTIDDVEIDTSILDSILPAILGPEDHIPNMADEDGSLFGGDEDYMSHEDGSVMLGGELDENGCLGSAGYTWCEKQNNCVRSWELEGEFEDECITGTTSSSDSSGESSSESLEDDLEKFFYNEDGTIKPWVFKCLMGLTVTAAILLICLIRVRRIRKRRRRRRHTTGVMLAENRDDYARFNFDENNFVFQETVAVKAVAKDAVPSRKEFINLV